jgi:hypothetical protein
LEYIELRQATSSDEFADILSNAKIIAKFWRQATAKPARARPCPPTKRRRHR